MVNHQKSLRAHNIAKIIKKIDNDKRKLPKHVFSQPFYYANERSHHNFEIRWKNCSFLLISARFHKQNGQEPPRFSQHINNTTRTCANIVRFSRGLHIKVRVEMLIRCIECRETLPGISIEISLLCKLSNRRPV